MKVYRDREEKLAAVVYLGDKNEAAQRKGRYFYRPQALRQGTSSAPKPCELTRLTYLSSTKHHSCNALAIVKLNFSYLFGGGAGSGTRTRTSLVKLTYLIDRGVYQFHHPGTTVHSSRRMDSIPCVEKGQ